MPRKETIQTDLLPGNVRVPLQLYDKTRRTYTQPPGYSLVAPRVSSPREFERLWRGVRDFIDGGAWRDAARSASTGE